MQIRVLAYEREAAVGRLEERLSACDREPGMVVGNDDMPTRAHDPGQFGNWWTKVVEVRERERAHRHVDFAVVDGEGAQVTVEEARECHAGASQLEHLGRAVHADHVVAPLDEVGGVAPGAAGGVEGTSHRECIE